MVTSMITSREEYHTSLLASRPAKRKHLDYDIYHTDSPMPKRMSPFLNTPKQRRDERRKVLRVSAKKLKAIDDPELSLRRSVLINNNFRRLRKEMINEKKFGYGYRSNLPASNSSISRIAMSPHPISPPPKRHAPCSDLDQVVNSSSSFNSNRLPAPDVIDDKITDDMSDDLARTVSALGTYSEEAMSVDTTDVRVTSPAPRVPLTTCAQEVTQTSRTSSDCSKLTESERQILGEMDVMFNKLYNVISEVVATC